MKNRDRNDIIAGILKVCENPSNTTTILYGVQLGHAQLKDYIQLVVACELIIESEIPPGKMIKSKHWMTTEKGRRFIKIYDTMMEMMKK